MIYHLSVTRLMMLVSILKNGGALKVDLLDAAEAIEELIRLRLTHQPLPPPVFVERDENER